MNLTDYLRVARKRWLLIVASLVVCVLASSAFVLTSTKKYEATAQIFVSTSGADDTNTAALAQGNTFVQARVQSYTSVALSPSVTSKVIAKLGLRITSDQLAAEITADAPLNKVLINIHVVNTSPTLAARLANAVADQFNSVVQSLEQVKSAGASPVKLTVIQPAQTPTNPVSPKTTLDIALGVLLGLIIGLGLAFMREMLDNTVKDPVELAEQSHLAVLGIVPWDKTAGDSPISFRADPHGSRSEGFRQLRTNLQFVDVDKPPKIIAVTSALPKEGKSSTAMNLATALAESGQQVCLIEADLRKPSIATALGLVGDVGLTSVLIGKSSLDSVLQNAGMNLAVVTSGPVPPNPSELISSEAFHRTLQEAAGRADVVIVDTAPLLPVADGAQIAAMADATLLVVRAGKTTRDQIRQAVDSLGRVDVVPVGAVLSMAQRRRGSDYPYYYAEYRPRPNSNSTGGAPDSTDRSGDQVGDAGQQQRLASTSFFVRLFTGRRGHVKAARIRPSEG